MGKSNDLEYSYITTEMTKPHSSSSFLLHRQASIPTDTTIISIILSREESTDLRKKGEAIALPRVIGIESSCSQANRTPRIALQFFYNEPRKDFP